MEIRTQDGQVMYESEFRAYTQANGGPSWGQTTPEVLESLGATVVLEGPQASGGTVYQFSMRQGVEQIDGKWYTKYVLGPVFTDITVDGVTTTAVEQEAPYKAAKDAEQAKAVREQRDQKLKDSDWTQVADAPVDKAVWATYRQALRDISTQETFPWDIAWPDAP
jgi:hypothetical protein